MTDKFEFIDGEKQNYPLVRMFVWMEVSSSGYYEWLRRPESATAARRGRLAVMIKWVFEDSDGTYGHRRIQRELARGGVQAGPELVRAIMRDLDLVACQPRQWRVTTVSDPGAPAIPDLVNRDFTAAAPGQKMVGDITYINTWAGWLYLATVIDCHTKMVLGWAMAEHMRTSLVSAAISMAARNHTLPVDAIFHSDRGCQYQCRSVRCPGAWPRATQRAGSTESSRGCRRTAGRASVGDRGVCTWVDGRARGDHSLFHNL